VAKTAKRRLHRKATVKKAVGKVRSNSEIKPLIDDLVAANRILYRQGVVDGFGHISARDPRDSLFPQFQNL
jgi:hypothetical protein